MSGTDEFILRAAPYSVSADARYSPRGILKPPTAEEEWKAKRRAPGKKRVMICTDRDDDDARGGPRESIDEGFDSLMNEHTTPEGAVPSLAEIEMTVRLPAEAEVAEATRPDGSTDGSDSYHDEMAKMDEALATIKARYKSNHVTLCFIDASMERKYVNFIMSNQGFIAGKIYAVLAGIIAFGLLFPYMNFHLTSEKMSQLSVVVLFTGISIGWLCFGLLFLEMSLPLREAIFFLAVATHWPAFASATVIIKEDEAYRYAYTTLCFMFCCFLAQPRFVGMFFFLTITPIATMFTATFTQDGYWDTHTRFEMMFWIMPLFPLFMLRIFEKRSRDAFLENERSKAAIEVLNHRVTMTKKLIARFFPVTAARRLLKTNGHENAAVYPSTALIATNVAGFTEWAAQTSVEMVVTRVAKMYLTMEKLAKRYGVEKVSTIGDTYLGAIFPTTAKPIKHNRRGSVHSDEEFVELLQSSSSGGFGSTNSTTMSVKLLPHRRLIGDSPPTEGSPASPLAAVSSPNPDLESSPGEQTPARLLSLESVDEHIARNKLALSSSRPDVIELNDVPKPRPESRHSASTASGSSRDSPQDSLTGERAHRALRYATAVRHHKDVMPVRIGVHIGPVIGGFVGIQPPKFDLFGLAVTRVRTLEKKSKKRRIHASQEIVDLGAEYGKPSDDFEASDSNGMIFSSWRANRELNSSTTMQNESTLQDSAAADFAFVEDSAMLLCAYLSRFAQVQQDRTLRGYEAREAMLKRLAVARNPFNQAAAPAAATAGRLSASVRPSPSGLETLATGHKGSPNTMARANAVALANGSGDADMADLEDLREPSDVGSNDSARDAANNADEDGEEDAPLLDDDHVMQIANPGEEEALYKFSVFRMVFVDRQVEAQYVRGLVKSQLSREVFLMFALMSLYVFLADVANTCATADIDRLKPVLIALVLLVHIGYLHYVGTSHGYNIVFVIATYSVMSWLAAMMSRASCDRPDAVIAAGNIIAMYFNQLGMSSSFSLETRMHVRILILLFDTLQFGIAIVIRRAVMQDEVLVWDGLLPTFVAAGVFISFFADLTMRSGFQATMRRRSLQNNRSAYAHHTGEALEMMMPAFVIDRLMRVARKSQRAGDMSDVASNQSSSSGRSGATHLSAMSALSLSSSGSSGHGRVTAGDVAQAVLMRRSETVWPYPRAVVMFISFEPPVRQYETISDTIARIEAVARSRNLQKIKSIGKKLLFIAGIDKSLPFDDAVINVIDAALEIQRRVFPIHLTEGWRHRIGINCGSIFGAVIGSQGLSFDVYGDAVNTVNIMMETAPSNAIQCAAPIRQALPHDDSELDFKVESIGMPVQIKGKGAMQVFHVMDRERHHRSTPSVAAPTKGGESHAAAPDQNADDASTESDERVPPSVIAASIRSSLRSAAMLPSAASPTHAFQYFAPRDDSIAGFDSDSDRPNGRAGGNGASSVASYRSGHSVGLRRPRHADVMSSSAGSAGSGGKGPAKQDGGAPPKARGPSHTPDDDPLDGDAQLNRIRMQVFDDDIAGFTSDDD
jgi:class 3 adenylate cyclase